jgi:riboflavin kinase/FMN adenylyltransferase
MTFTESPKLALQPYQPELMLHIVNQEEREHKMKWHGVEALFLLDFSSKFASLTGQEFFDTYVRALKPAIIVAGFDYTFGSDKKTADDLKDYFDTHAKG